MEKIITTNVLNQSSPELLRSEIDSRIVKIRPMSTPIDQISRHAATRHAGSMTVEYYAVDSKPYTATVTADCFPDEATEPGENVEMNISVDDESPFVRSETVLFPDITTTDGMPVTAFITEVSTKNLKGYFTCTDSKGVVKVPTITAGSKIVRMGRAARELDMQTVQFQAIPRKEKNFCQIFKSQVEQSTLVKLSNKEVGWSFSDQEEAAIIDMRLGMERNFLFGNKMHLEIAGEDDVMLTGGIWSQAGKELQYSRNALTDKTMVSICHDAFTASNGSSRKLLIAGSRFIEQMQNLPNQRILGPADKMTRWGLDFTTYVTKFGTLYVLMSETFDECGHAYDALIVDPEYITKYTHIPFNTEKLDLRASGVRNTDAIVITEASCLVLRYPKAHMRVIGK